MMSDDRATGAPSGLEGTYLTLHEIVKAARHKLTRTTWDYLVGGVETETTLRRNRLAIDSLAFRPQVLTDVSEVDPSGSFFGRAIRLPVLLAPVGGLESFDPGAGVTVAQAAAQFGVPMFLSSVSAPGLGKAWNAAAEGCRIYQLYVRGDGDFIDERVRAAIDSGFSMFCITVDTAVVSRRERDMANRFLKPWNANETGRRSQAKFNWSDIERFKSKHQIPLILKGIARARDAERACDLGVDAVYVSNHGGRQLDHGRGAIDILPEVVQAVRGRAKIIVDGGFSRGSDIVKAMVLGADVVSIGRLYCYGLAARGAAGIVRVLELLEEEIVSCLGLLGVPTFPELDSSFVCPAPPVTQPGVHSAFPLLDFVQDPY